MLLRQYLEQGWSNTALADRLGISRSTVYEWIASGQLPREVDDQAVKYRALPCVARKIDDCSTRR